MENMFEIMGKEFSKKMENMDNFMLQSNKAFANITETLKLVMQENAENKNSIKKLESTMSDTSLKADKALEKITFRDENSFGEDWLNQSDIGLLFEPMLTSHDVGQVLKIIGYTKKSKTQTIPYSNVIKSGKVRRGYNAKYSTWYFYSDKVKDDFIKYMQSKNLYEEFLALTSETQVKEFINKLKSV